MGLFLKDMNTPVGARYIAPAQQAPITASPAQQSPASLSLKPPVAHISKKISNRHSFRADWVDYDDGIFFVTICCHCKNHLFGVIHSDEIELTQLGLTASQFINEIPRHHIDTEVMNYVVMPNHIHMVISIHRGQEDAKSEYGGIGCLKKSSHGVSCGDFHHNSRLALIVGSYKAAVTRVARARCIAPLPVWQRLYHEHRIRDGHSFENIMNYIDSNITNWRNDCFYK